MVQYGQFVYLIILGNILHDLLINKNYNDKEIKRYLYNVNNPNIDKEIKYILNNHLLCEYFINNNIDVNEYFNKIWKSIEKNDILIIMKCLFYPSISFKQMSNNKEIKEKKSVNGKLLLFSTYYYKIILLIKYIIKKLSYRCMYCCIFILILS